MTQKNYKKAEFLNTAFLTIFVDYMAVNYLETDNLTFDLFLQTCNNSFIYSLY